MDKSYLSINSTDCRVTPLDPRSATSLAFGRLTLMLFLLIPFIACSTPNEAINTKSTSLDRSQIGTQNILFLGDMKSELVSALESLGKVSKHNMGQSIEKFDIIVIDCESSEGCQDEFLQEALTAGATVALVNADASHTSALTDITHAGHKGAAKLLVYTKTSNQFNHPLRYINLILNVTDQEAPATTISEDGVVSVKTISSEEETKKEEANRLTEEVLRHIRTVNEGAKAASVSFPIEDMPINFAFSSGPSADYEPAQFRMDNLVPPQGACYAMVSESISFTHTASEDDWKSIKGDTQEFSGSIKLEWHVYLANGGLGLTSVNCGEAVGTYYVLLSMKSEGISPGNVLKDNNDSKIHAFFPAMIKLGVVPLRGNGESITDGQFLEDHWPTNVSSSVSTQFSGEVSKSIDIMAYTASGSIETSQSFSIEKDGSMALADWGVQDDTNSSDQAPAWTLYESTQWNPLENHKPIKDFGDWWEDIYHDSNKKVKDLPDLSYQNIPFEVISLWSFDSSLAEDNSLELQFEGIKMDNCDYDGTSSNDRFFKVCIVGIAGPDATGDGHKLHHESATKSLSYPMDLVQMLGLQ